jgi:prepilin-type N-terminal cleavage/methylation domain-containing protein
MLNKTRKAEAPGDRQSEAGFTLIETMIALVVLTIGLLGVAAAISYSIAANNMSRNVTSAKLLVNSVAEQMQTLINNRELSFGQLANEGAVNNVGAITNFAGFSAEFKPIAASPGPDGIYGSCDDTSTARGADGLWCTGDDTKNPALERPGFTHRIIITNLSLGMKKVETTIRYPGKSGTTQELTGVSYVTDKARTNNIN